MCWPSEVDGSSSIFGIWFARQGFNDDQYVNTTTTNIDGVPIGPAAASPWLLVTPQYFPPLLQWIHHRYPDLDIYVTENGVDVPNENSLPLAQALNDTYRINYLQQYISAMEGAMQAGVPLKGYFCWSLMDNFEVRDLFSPAARAALAWSSCPAVACLCSR